MDFAEFYLNEKECILCTAIHNGHGLVPLIAANMALNENERLYEEDPHTGYFTEICENRIIVQHSRFEIDLNRPSEKAFYIMPEQAWGLKVRKKTPAPEEIELAMSLYNAYYEKVQENVNHLLKTHKRIFVYDLHSYNHQRLGAGMPFDDPAKNPEIILGTNNMPEKWFPLVEMVQKQLISEDYSGRSLDVRINVKFDGGHFSRWLHATFPDQVICIALEFKKIFMDEWSGEVDWKKAERLREILASTLLGIREFLSEK
ncbi:MAG: N-formylglutamate amidohydrolase [Candidatus Cloacimonetes bacterium]|nr:N-formylglutamate amidohydrolase [Candidatus Cloacimonadota bacterium]